MVRHRIHGDKSGNRFRGLWCGDVNKLGLRGEARARIGRGWEIMEKIVSSPTSQLRVGASRYADLCRDKRDMGAWTLVSLPYSVLISVTPASRCLMSVCVKKKNQTLVAFA